MLALARENRWMIALLFLLAGQVGTVRASVAPSCQRTQSTSSEWAVTASVDPSESSVLAFDGMLAEHEHGTEHPNAQAMAPVCGASALLSEDQTAFDPPPFRELVRASADTALPRLDVHGLFRPPRLS